MFNRKKSNRLLILGLALAGLGWYANAEAKKEIYIDKPAFRLYVVEETDTIVSYPVCLAENLGQKKRAGDHKTPEGDFSIVSMEPASGWTHKGKDGKVKKGVYGPWFFRLKCPQSTHIGIHGTDRPETIGTRDSEGCIRLHNEDLLQLKEHIYIGMPVHISSESGFPKTEDNSEE